MVTRSVRFAEGEFYHVYNRGVEKRVIFNEESDKYRFLELLYLSNSTDHINVRDIKLQYGSVFDFQKGSPLVSIGAYCLMPNHFHLLVTPLVDGGVAKFLNKLGTSYSMYFNKRYERTGRLFEGSYKAQHADNDTYLKYLYAYIHLNPLKLHQTDWRDVGLNDKNVAWKHLTTYRYSSLPFYLGQNREDNCLLEVDSFPAYFREVTDHQEELFDWIDS
jgi:putative transposase